ncbi:hypothetical protein GOODEAATRI_022937 [Goodea atripinnis]|uniref:Uncharacterized protein n=1 Tax=Goodea atripinnis TaxID=208336 RepID=A0ABV0MMZ9_9TELE
MCARSQSPTQISSTCVPWTGDGQTDQQRLHAAVPVTPPPFRGILETVLSSPEQGSVLKSELQKLLIKNFISRVPQGEENSAQENRRNETNTRSAPVQQIDHGEMFPHADNQSGAGEHSPE